MVAFSLFSDNTFQFKSKMTIHKSKRTKAVLDLKSFKISKNTYMGNSSSRFSAGIRSNPTASSMIHRFSYHQTKTGVRYVAVYYGA